MVVKIWTKRKIRRFIERRLGLSKTLLTIGAFIIIFLLTAFGIYNYMLLPQIDLKGNKKVVINYKSNYVEKGYNASFLGKDVTKDVAVFGDVDSEKLGTYEIAYQVQKGFFHKKVIRKIIVKDLKKPKLEIDDKEIYLCPGDDVVPEKVKAFDNYDGDISDKVVNIVSVDKSAITYKVKDSSGNSQSVTKRIIYKDVEKPIIQLNGNAYQYVFLGDAYKDPSVTVTDNCDKDISSKVTVTGGVDTNKTGEYEIVYSVKDFSGNISTMTRKVRVSERGSNGTIYLTFDDGPNQGTTDIILNVLKEEGVPATFFVTSRGPDELIKRAYDEGHTIALHTSSHDYSVVYSSEEAYFNDLNKVGERVKRITGQESKIIRFPGGSSNTISRRYSQGIMSRLTSEVINRGYKYYDWNLSSGDAAGGNPSPDDIYNNVINNLSHDRVNMVLMHDIKTYTRDSLRRIIRYGKENGYSFEKITMDTKMITQRVNN